MTTVLKNCVLGISLAVTGSCLLMPVFAAAPVKIAEVAPVADLVNEAQEKIAELETSLATNDSYLQAKKTGIPVDASTLAILAQAIAESQPKADWKASAPDLRDAAAAVAKATSYEEAKKGLEAIKAAASGKTNGAKVDHDWKLAKLGHVMSEVNRRNGKLRRAARKMPADPSEVSRDATVLAVLALDIHADTHEVKKDSDKAKWQKFALDMQTGMTEASAAFKKKDVTAAKNGFTKASKSCGACHEAFRDQ
jgi:hypothetical protein